MSRLAVESQESLAREPWAAHLRDCGWCRAEAAEHARAVSIFRAVEGQLLAERHSSLTWEEMRGVLDAELDAAAVPAGDRGRHRPRRSISIAAVAAGVLAVSAAIGWNWIENEGTPAPARIVLLQPHEQRSMEQVLRWTLESEDPGADARTPSMEEDRRFGAVEWGRSPLDIPEGRELAATVSPLQQDTAGGGNDRRPAAAGRAPITSFNQERRPNTQPASNRYGKNETLFRLEHRLIPTQPVSLSMHD